jgi:hypothetical protein
MAKELFALGVELRRIVVCADEVEIIARDLRELKQSHDIVITSGGVGPTHDDVTIKRGRPGLRSEGGDAPCPTSMLLREYYGERLTEMHLRMADVPEGARLLATPGDALAHDRRGQRVRAARRAADLSRQDGDLARRAEGLGAVLYSRAVYVALDEPTLAPLLDALAPRTPT